MDNFHKSADGTLVPVAGLGSNEQEAVTAETVRGAPGGDLGPPARLPQFKQGDLIDDRFAVVRFLARGGMGEVYEVEDRHLRGIHVALKTILSQYAADPVMRDRFEREVLSARGVVHPNLCPMYDLGHWKRPEAQLTYLTMKLLPGESLAARLLRDGPLPDEEALCVLKQVGAGIAAAHDAGILHRDIKTANIIVQGSAEQVFAWVTDFGLARAALSDDTALTTHGVVGTPGFMAPELFYGSSPTQASDVYALGVVAYVALVGRLPHISVPKGKNAQAPFNSAEIPESWKRFVEGCLRPAVAERFQTVRQAMQAMPAQAARGQVRTSIGQRISRRKMLMMGAGASAGTAIGAWLEWPHVVNLIDPLPSTRFVALMALPTDRPPALLSTVMDSIGQRLSRAEASVKNLLIIAPRDRPGPAVAIDSLGEVQNTLGANLVLTASLDQSSSQARLNLRLLDANSQRVLRKGAVACALDAIGSLAQKASQKAASLLQLPGSDVPLSDPEELSRVPLNVYQAYSEAQQLLNEPNHAGLEQAIEKYQQTLDLDRHFALAYARLAIAYIRQFYVRKEPANLDLAGSNAASALFYNPRSAMGLVSQALVLVCRGKAEDAQVYFKKAQQADPGNPEILFYKAWGLDHQGLLADAEQAYRDVIAVRPNYWPAYNNLGAVLTRQANYPEAAKAFAAAGAAAPKVAQPMGNLAQTYLKMGRRDEARQALHEGLRRAESEDSYLALGDLDFMDGKYNDALTDYGHADKLNPRNHLTVRNMGDCYTVLGNAKMARQCYERAAQVLSALLNTNPRDGFGWANMAFYDAKLGNRQGAEKDMENAKAHIAGNDVDSRFMFVQALAVLGRKKDALDLLLWCMDKGVSPADVDLALDLKDLRSTVAYRAKLKQLKGNGNTAT
jgi:serine/threonine protein kinase/predicted Zn-dependent protease